MVGVGSLFAVRRQVAVADAAELSGLVDEVDDVGPDADVHVGHRVGVGVAVGAVNHVLGPML